MTHASYWQENRHLQRSCPPGVPEEIWFDVSARFNALSDDAHLCPGLNGGRVGEVMVILRRQGKVTRTGKDWSIP